MSVPDWIGTVLAALGHHIRHLEDANSKLRYENQSHQAFRQFDRDQITQLKDEIEGKLEGSITEQLALDNNALIEVCRNWTSWAGQAQAFRKDVMALLHSHGFDRQADMNAVARFNTRVRDGAYDTIPFPVPFPTPAGDNYGREGQEELGPEAAAAASDGPGRAAQDADLDGAGGERPDGAVPDIKQSLDAAFDDGYEGVAGTRPRGTSGAGLQADAAPVGDRPGEQLQDPGRARPETDRRNP